MSRLRRTDPVAYTPEQRAVADAIERGARGKLAGPLLLLLEHPALCAAVQEVGRVLRYDGVLEPRLRELAILTTARHWRATYEWRSHAPLAAAAGLSADAIESIRGGDEPGDDDLAAATHRFCRTLLTGGAPEDAIVSGLTARLGQPAVLELAALVGYYSLIAHVLTIDDDRDGADGERLFTGAGDAS